MIKPFKRVFFVRLAMASFWIAVFVGLLFIPGATRFAGREKSLNIFTWPMLLDAQYLSKFEAETGIKLNISYYENNEELLSKLEATKGQGYDLIIPSDYIVESLVSGGLVKKLDRSKIAAFDRINPALLGHYFDAHNEYSIPYYWACYGIGYNKDSSGGVVPPATLGLLFNKQSAFARITMPDSARETMLAAALYAFGTIEHVFDDPEKITAIKDVLIKQKQWVEVYTEARAAELLFSRSVDAVYALSSEIQRIASSAPYVDFLIPDEGSFLLLDVIMIPAVSTKDDLTYQFINYIFNDEMLKHNFIKFGSFPPIRAIFDEVIDSGAIRPIVMPNNEQISKFSLIRNVIPQVTLNDLWIKVMGS